MTPVFPTVYFGNVNYFRSIILQSEVMIESKEHFIKQTYRNRFEILTSNGIQQLSIPVIRKNGSKTVIDEIEISYDTDWRKDHWKAIESAYSNSPYFDHYGIEVRELIYQNESNLLKFNLNIQNRLFKWLGIEVNSKFTIDFEKSESNYLNTLNQTRINDKTEVKKYIQVFGKSGDFESNLSILDAIFCLGPMARNLLI
jgi:hypothetical protein